VGKWVVERLAGAAPAHAAYPHDLAVFTYLADLGDDGPLVGASSQTDANAQRCVGLEGVASQVGGYVALEFDTSVACRSYFSTIPDENGDRERIGGGHRHEIKC
jgi:hypothetical protein